MFKQKIFLILFGLTLILGISELFLRLNPKFEYRYHSFRFKSKKLALDDMSYMRPSVLLGYELIPSFSVPNFPASANSYGLIGREYKINYEDCQIADYSAICKVVKDLKIPYYNLHNLYVQLFKENFPLREEDEDDIHPSKEAHRLIARKISNYILDNFLNKD